MLGPAMVAGVAYLIQYLSAKLGIATGLSLLEDLGQRFRRRPTRLSYWVQAELVAMATGGAEPWRSQTL